MAGTTPLMDLGAGTYMGYEGGLYAGGHNRPPAAHEAEAIRRASAIEPIDGAIVMISVGISNTLLEFAPFVTLAMDHPDRNAALLVVNGAQSGRDINMWTRVGSPVWDTLNDNLTRRGARPDQVRVVWLKQAARNPDGGFPGHALFLQERHELLVQQVLEHYPNVELVYLSSRTRECTDGSDGNVVNPEPYAYEAGFAVRWTIDAQIEGDPMLNYDASRGPVLAPLLLWGPYIWAEATPRSDGFAWPCTYATVDPDVDCTPHPSEAGENAIAAELLRFFSTDPTATPWFLRDGAAPRPDAGTGDFDGGAALDGGTSPDGAIAGWDGSPPSDGDSGPETGDGPPPIDGTGDAGCACDVTGDGAPPAPLGAIVLLILASRCLKRWRCRHRSVRSSLAGYVLRADVNALRGEETGIEDPMPTRTGAERLMILAIMIALASSTGSASGCVEDVGSPAAVDAGDAATPTGDPDAGSAADGGSLPMADGGGDPRPMRDGGGTLPTSDGGGMLPMSDGGRGGGGTFTCTRVIGFSQTRSWYVGGGEGFTGPSAFESAVGDDSWELLWQSGGAVGVWANPDSPAWDNPIVSPCAHRAAGDAPDRVVLTISGDDGSNVDVWESRTRSAIDNIRAKYPAVRQIVLQPVVGGPMHTECPLGDGTPIRASFQHPFIDQAIARIVGADVAAGADPLVRTCADYVLDQGHLVREAANPIGGAIGEYYALLDAAAGP